MRRRRIQCYQHPEPGSHVHHNILLRALPIHIPTWMERHESSSTSSATTRTHNFSAIAYHLSNGLPTKGLYRDLATIGHRSHEVQRFSLHFGSSCYNMQQFCCFCVVLFFVFVVFCFLFC